MNTALTPAQRAEAEQSRASDPLASAWVSASAGSGKTKLLTDRVLRLMLAGTPPGRILCLTFTKAAAAEMAQRLNKALGEWAVAEDATLRRLLTRLLGQPPKISEEALARRLFAEVLELPGGMRISTIHAFCQSLLRAFPLEAGLPPQFSVLEDADAQATLTEAREGVLARGSALLEGLAEKISADRFAGLVKDMAGSAARIDEAIQGSGGLALLRAALANALGAPADGAAALEAGCMAGDNDALARAAAMLRLSGNVNDRERGAKLSLWLAEEAAGRAAGFAGWCGIFLTNEGTVRKTLATKGGMPASFAEVQDILAREGERILRLRQSQVAAGMVDSTLALLGLAEPVLAAYAEAKSARAQLDFNDLIEATGALLRDPGSAWVLFKLDSGLDHILVDEAQDSNPAQWRIVKALSADFFSGEGATETPRSVFAVGDVKQSIYGFQGADPTGFSDSKGHFSARVLGAAGRFEDVPLDVSFRSTPAVLGLVDATFAGPARDGVVEAGNTMRHIPHRAGAAGLVELWPLQLAAKSGPPAPWAVPEETEAEAHAQARLAAAIARRIAHMLAHETLPARADGPGQPEGRRIRPDDILILVRSRNALARLIIRELKQALVPVGGLDRIALTAQIGVMDVLALLDVLLMPRDDLQLAALLKSPLPPVSLTEEELFALARGRDASLHAQLMEHRGQGTRYALAADWIAGWAARADRATPHALLAELLGADGGRARLLARLGPEAAEGLDELLNAALTHEGRHAPSLQGFLHWLRQGGAEVKRDAEQAQGLVRLMTVHGAKGLQAPIVILPDTVRRPPAESGLRWLPDGERELPLWIPVKEMPRPDVVDALSDAEARQKQQEENRLLYVALTRAEDRLLVCGWAGEKGARDVDWYSQIAQGFSTLGAEPMALDPDMVGADGFAGEGARFATPQTDPPREEPAREAARSATLPGWAAIPAELERLPGALSPSALLDEEAGPPAAAPHAPGDPAARRFLRGRLIHALLQHLPLLPLAERDRAAERFLARPGHAISAEEQAAIAAETRTLLHDARFAAAFGPESLAEAPIAGRIGGQLYAGQVDRLLVEPGRVLLIDYKTNRPPPELVEAVSPAYLKQMAAYRALLRLAFPGRVVETALLWTYAARLMPLPDGLLDIHAPAA
ncbi:double-strand break repair helicase AddA [Rhodovarius crocodyli]|uniref:DNA 3'-5' helicase n=1 Tax=Rhodovarius crocodyli TaxID=1979269 RepID=A0A437LW49_9PROT|nr:double-strand break repair helicase AddA [Rhodovarius crocodyli]RVT89628.1 double-strand break repair helicase AddA [Rhodovarius crocodyli]